jgi:hyperosmotically inducible protein
MRVILNLLLAVVLLGVLGFVLITYWPGALVRPAQAPQTTGTTGAIDTEKAREQGAEIGEKAAEAAEKVKETIAEARITAKIKTKMALDDSVKARSIDVSTAGSTVTLSGVVGSRAEHERAVALARETQGVDRVVDRLQIR